MVVQDLVPQRAPSSRICLTRPLRVIIAPRRNRWAAPRRILVGTSCRSDAGGLLLPLKTIFAGSSGMPPMATNLHRPPSQSPLRRPHPCTGIACTVLTSPLPALGANDPAGGHVRKRYLHLYRGFSSLLKSTSPHATLSVRHREHLDPTHLLQHYVSSTTVR